MNPRGERDQGRFMELQKITRALCAVPEKRQNSCSKEFVSHVIIIFPAGMALVSKGPSVA